MLDGLGLNGPPSVFVLFVIEQKKGQKNEGQKNEGDLFIR